MSDTLENTDTRETLYVTDAELIRRSGVPEKIMRGLLHEFDRNPGRSGFPQKVKLFGNRRYWPAVRSYMDAYNRLKIEPSRNGGAR